MEEAQSYLQKALKKSTEETTARSRGRVLLDLAACLGFGPALRRSQSDGRRAEVVQNNEDVYSHAEQAVLQYQGLGVLATTYENMAEPQKAKTCKSRVTALRVKEGSRCGHTSRIPTSTSPGGPSSRPQGSRKRRRP